MNNKDNNNQKNQENMDISHSKNPLKLGYQLGFILHQNFSVHVLLTVMINLLVSAIIIGIFSIFYPILAVYSWQSFMIGILFYSLMELSVKILLIRFMWKVIIQSFGLVLFIVNVVLYWIVSVSIKDFTFLDNPSNIFIYTTAFMAVRMLFTTYVRKSGFIQRGA